MKNIFGYVKERFFQWFYCAGIVTGLCLTGAECETLASTFLVSAFGLACMAVFGILFVHECEAGEMRRWKR